jgi:Tfp pilus assembly protein PilN
LQSGSNYTTRHRQKEKIENYPLTLPPSCQLTTIRKNYRERTTINGGTRIISITATTQSKTSKRTMQQKQDIYQQKLQKE